MSEIYSHWSRTPLVLKPDFDYGRSSSVIRGFKPIGLWFDVNGEWYEVGFSYEPEYFKYRNVLNIDTGSLLRLSTPLDLDAFTERYAAEEWDVHLFGRDYRSGINWSPLYGLHKGILIAPYCWQRRRKPRTSWYHPWDCASGCIWDLSAIHNVTTTEVAAVSSEEEDSIRED